MEVPSNGRRGSETRARGAVVRPSNGEGVRLTSEPTLRGGGYVNRRRSLHGREAAEEQRSFAAEDSFRVRQGEGLDSQSEPFVGRGAEPCPSGDVKATSKSDQPSGREAATHVRSWFVEAILACIEELTDSVHFVSVPDLRGARPQGLRARWTTVTRWAVEEFSCGRETVSGRKDALTRSSRPQGVLSRGARTAPLTGPKVNTHTVGKPVSIHWLFTVCARAVTSTVGR